MLEEDKKKKLKKQPWQMYKKLIVWILFVQMLICTVFFVYKKVNQKLMIEKYIKTMNLTKNLQNDIKIATLNKEETKLILKIESKTIVEKINFVNGTGNKIGEIAINTKHVDEILDVPAGTKFLNVSYANAEDNKILVRLDEEKTYIDTYKKEKEIFVVLKNKSGINKVEYFITEQSYEPDLEGGQILNEFYIPLEVEKLLIENGFGEVITLNIQDEEVIKENSLRTENSSLNLEDLKALEGDYVTVINVSCEYT